MKARASTKMTAINCSKSFKNYLQNPQEEKAQPGWAYTS